MLSKFREQQERRLGKIQLEETSSITQLDTFFSDMSSKYGISYEYLIEILKKRKNYVTVPAALFNSTLSPLENVVFYLYLKFGFTQTEIATLLKRDPTTIWTTLENAKKKVEKAAYLKIMDKIDKGGLLVPVQIFSDAKLSILESASLYLKQKHDMSYHEIAVIFGKDDRTIWTVVHRANKKLGD